MYCRYRLSEPAEKYAPWFAVPLKTARLAVKVLQLLKLEARASKLSFNDVIKRLAAQEPTELTFISKKVRCCCAAGVGLLLAAC